MSPFGRANFRHNFYTEAADDATLSVDGEAVVNSDTGESSRSFEETLVDRNLGQRFLTATGFLHVLTCVVSIFLLQMSPCMFWARLDRLRALLDTPRLRKRNVNQRRGT